MVKAPPTLQLVVQPVAFLHKKIVTCVSQHALVSPQKSALGNKFGGKQLQFCQARFRFLLKDWITTWTGPESVIKVRKDQVPGRVDGTTHGSIQVGLPCKCDVVVGVCLAVPNPTFHAWLHLGKAGLDHGNV